VTPAIASVRWREFFRELFFTMNFWSQLFRPSKLSGITRAKLVWVELAFRPAFKPPLCWDEPVSAGGIIRSCPPLLEPAKEPGPSFVSALSSHITSKLPTRAGRTSPYLSSPTSFTYPEPVPETDPFMETDASLCFSPHTVSL
jgi:hypothetical protein